MTMRRLLIPCLCLGALLCAASALAGDIVNPDAKPGESPPVLETARKLAAPIHGNLSSEDLKALQQANQEKAAARDRSAAAQPPQPAPQSPKKNSGKAIYGDIIIHK